MNVVYKLVLIQFPKSHEASN